MKYVQRFLVVLLLAFVSSQCDSPQNVEIGITAPIQAKMGEEFVIVTTVKNTASEPQTLVSLDIGDAYLNGIAILRTEPDFREASHIPIDNTMSYVFKLTIDEGDDVEVWLYAKAIKSGDHRSEIDFCINSEFSFITKPIRTIVD
jgi:hypothetical protein